MRTIVTPRNSVLSYSTSFPLTENPISEGGAWLAPPTGWTNVRSTPGDAFGTQSAHTPPPFDDSVAIRSVAYPPNHSVQCTMHMVGAVGTRAQEVELLLRATQGSNTLSLYEIDIKITGAFHFVQWNGALNDFTVLRANVTNNVVIADGAVWYASIVGRIITVKCNGLVCDTYDTTGDAVPLSTGRPGTGMWGTNGDPAADFGWQNYSDLGL